MVRPELETRTGGNAIQRERATNGIKDADSKEPKHGSRTKPPDFAIPRPRAMMHVDAFHLHLQRQSRGSQTAASEPKKELASALASARVRPRLRPLAADALKIPNFRATLAVFWPGFGRGAPSDADGALSAARSAVCSVARRSGGGASLFSTKQVPCSSRFPPFRNQYYYNLPAFDQQSYRWFLALDTPRS